jgi:hypothetical protein
VKRIVKSTVEPDVKKLPGGWRNYIMRSFIICTLPKTIVGLSNKGRSDG